MPQRDDFAKDYIQVAERIAAFHAAFPEGSLQSDILTLNESEVLVKAWAYRTPEDTRPGIGHARETIPGSTPYTRGSEVENAETSAWGRAIAALGFEVKRGIATAEDVRNAQARQPTQNAPQRPAPRPVASTPRSEPPRASTAPVQGLQPLSVREAMDAVADFDRKEVSRIAKDLVGTWSFKEMTDVQRAQVVAAVRGGEGGVPAQPSPASPPADDEDWAGLLDQAPAA